MGPCCLNRRVPDGSVEVPLVLVQFRTGRRIHRKGLFDLIRKPRCRRELHSIFCLSKPPTATDGLASPVARHQDHHPSCTLRSTASNACPTLACHSCREFTRLSLHPVVASTRGIITAMNCQTTSWCTLVDSPASRVSKTIQLWKNQIARAALA